MRQLDLATQAQLKSLLLAQMSDGSIHGVLGAKPIELFVQGAAPLAVSENASQVVVDGVVGGPLLFPDSPAFTDGDGRVVNTGTFASRFSDGGYAWEKSFVRILDAATRQPVISDGGEQMGAFLYDVNGVRTLYFVHLESEDVNDYALYPLPDGVTSIVFQTYQRSTVDSVTAGDFQTGELLEDAEDAETYKDLLQLMKDVYGATGSFANTGAGVLSRSVLDQIADHLVDALDAHDASAISVAPTGGLVADDVQEALEELQGEISLGSFTDEFSPLADTAEFVLTHTPLTVDSIRLTLNQYRQPKNTVISLVGKTLTVPTVRPGSTLQVDYDRAD